MDELQRLYEHQTMMAIGIYSFLDNLLSHIPPRDENDNIRNLEQDHSPVSRDSTNLQETTSGLTQGLLTINRSDTFRDRHERIRMSTWAINERIPTLPSTDNSEARLNNDINADCVVEAQSKIIVEAGGYPEDIFIYLSDHEREEYRCAVCYSVLKEAYQCQNDHRFCYGCIYTWSTGPTIGHDSCPVCRCDGLYAKNIDLNERIGKKRVRCSQAGCNWMGLLNAFCEHDHRRYSPFELDILLSECKKSVINPQIEEIKPIPEQPIQSAPKSVEVTHVNNIPEPGMVPVLCEPLNHTLNSTSITRESIENIGQDLLNSQHRTRNSRVMRSRPRISSSNRTQSRQNTPTNNAHRTVRSRTPVNTNHLRPSSLRMSSNGGQVSQSFGVARAFRPVRSNNQPLIQDSRTNVNRLSSISGRSSIETATNSIRESHRPTSRPPSSMSLRTQGSAGHPTPMSRLPTVRTVRTLQERTSRETPTLGDLTNLNRITGLNQTELPNVSVNTHPSGSNETPNFEFRENITISSLDEQQSDIRPEQVTLPAIGPIGTLTQGNSTREGEQVEPNEFQQGNSINDAGPRNDQPLEFRRLVPRRQGRVIEQLRETREQLAAMLRLMTMELEERRQHVLNARLESSTRNRLLRNTNSQPSMENIPEIATMENSTRSRLLRITNAQSSMDISVTHQGSQRDINTNMIMAATSQGENYAGRVFSNRYHLIRESNRNLQPIPQSYAPNIVVGYRDQAPNLLNPVFREQTNETHDTSFVEESPGVTNSNTSPLSTTTRLLARLRLNSLSQNTPSVLLVSNNRNLGSLLTEMPNNPSVTGWSSEED